MESDAQTIVVALGGNAITVPGEEGSIPQQFARTRETAKHLVDCIEHGFHLAVTHGNGPQVGNILRRVEIASSELYAVPLEVCVADTQAGMGYMIAQCLMNELHRRGEDRSVTTLVTTVLVDRDDPAFAKPTKPIGPRMRYQEATNHEQRDGWQITEVEPGYYRRIVPSPIPQSILELETIRQLVMNKQLVVCCGGGGIPVYVTEDGTQQGAAAVIDKDLTSAILAAALGVSQFLILAAVPEVYTNFNKPNQMAIASSSACEARRYLGDGHFGEGSMAPKIEAALSFLELSSRTDARVVITDAKHAVDGLAGRAGTTIHQ